MALQRSLEEGTEKQPGRLKQALKSLCREAAATVPLGRLFCAFAAHALSAGKLPCPKRAATPLPALSLANTMREEKDQELGKICLMQLISM